MFVKVRERKCNVDEKDAGFNKMALSFPGLSYNIMVFTYIWRAAVCTVCIRESVYRDWFGLSVPHLCVIHWFNTRFPTTPHSDVINHDGSVWDSESKLLQITKEKICRAIKVRGTLKAMSSVNKCQLQSLLSLSRKNDILTWCVC